MSRILIVDDEQQIRNVLGHYLQLHGHAVMTAADAAAALDAAEQGPDWDLIITDVMMPGIDGLELARIVRLRWPATKVVLMSGCVQNPGAADLPDFPFLPKPFTAHEFRRLIDSILAAPQG